MPSSTNPNRVAVYAGSFDPITNGHMWLLVQASLMFDKVIVAIGHNPAKKYRFTLEQRLQMVRDSAASCIGNIECAVLDQNKYLAHYASSVGAKYLIRGIRNYNDFEYEMGMRHINASAHMAPGITTVFLMPPKELSEVSSSLVKGLVGPRGWEYVVRDMVPAPVFNEFRREYPAKVIGITGNIGAGKSTVSGIINNLTGWPVFNADTAASGHCLNEVWPVIQKRWPELGGEVSRPKLADIIFNDADARKWVESLIFPLVEEHMRLWISSCCYEACIVDAPLLFESGFDKYCDSVVAVVANDNLRIQRVQARSNMSTNEWLRRDRMQMHQEEKQKRAEFTIFNNMDETMLGINAEKLVKQLQEKLF